MKPAVPPQLVLEQADPQMQLRWDQWHHRVIREIYQHYVKLTRGRAGDGPLT